MASLNLHSTNLGDATRPGQNPFTSEQVVFHLDDGLSSEQREAVKSFLKFRRASAPDDSRYCRISIAPQQDVLIGIGTLESEHRCVALVVEFDAATQEVANLVFSLAGAADMVIGSTVAQYNACISRNQLERVAGRWPSATIVPNAGELFTWVNYGLQSRQIA